MAILTFYGLLGLLHSMKTGNNGYMLLQMTASGGKIAVKLLL